MLTLASLLRGNAQSEMPMIEDRPMSRAERLREWMASRNAPQQSAFPPGKDGVTPLMRPDLDAGGRPGSFGAPQQAGNPLVMNQDGIGRTDGLAGLPPGIMAILAARMGDRNDSERFPPGKDGITPLPMRQGKFPPGKDGVTPLQIGERSLTGPAFGKRPGGY